jgi:hypothetical protein
LVLPVCVEDEDILCAIEAQDIFRKFSHMHPPTPFTWKVSERKSVWKQFEDDLARLDTGSRSDTAGVCRFLKGLQEVQSSRGAGIPFIAGECWFKKKLVAGKRTVFWQLNLRTDWVTQGESVHLACCVREIKGPYLVADL